MLLARRPEGGEFWTIGDEVIAWIEEHCVLTDSAWIGQPFRVMPWQRRLLLELFEVDPETMRRRYRMALVGVGRKNAKSELAAALALWLAFGQGDASASVYCAAASEEQADVVFEKARRMCELSPTLSRLVRVPEGRRQSSPRIALASNPYQFVQRLSAKGTTKHGLNPAGVILDELHVWSVQQAEELYQALTTAMAARPNGLIFAITTAGSFEADESRCWALYELGKKVQAGEVDDPTFFFRWWEAPRDCRLDDPEAWRAANPSLGLIMDEDFYRGELVRHPEPYFRRLYLNQWVDIDEAKFVTEEQLDACRLERFELRPGEPTWVGVDLSETRDTTAVVLGQMWDGEDRPCGHTGEPCLYVRSKGWAPPRLPDGRRDPEWEVPIDEVRDYLLEVNRKYDVLSNAFDPWHSRLLQQDLERAGVACEEVHATGARRTGATALLHQLIAGQRFHYCDEVLRRHLLNAGVRDERNGTGYYLVKRRNRAMDMAMALVNVCYGLEWAKRQPKKPVIIAWARL